ncbi:MAG: hypothetical protein FWF28_06440 [Micrococcales bacterium]|nr:hypothetical protein [Micrococcales bacterium]
MSSRGSNSTVRSLTLDTGALIAFERADPHIRSLLAVALGEGLALDIPVGVLAQAWRGDPEQTRLARLLSDVRVLVVELDEPTARAVGVLCGRSGHRDVVDVSVVLHARLHHHTILTSDPDDLAAIDPDVPLVVV